jgi:hypothetical protein
MHRQNPFNRLFGKVILLSILFVTLIDKNALAQSCTSALSNQLVACADNAITSCGNAIKECEPNDYALTLKDVKEFTIGNCCRFKTKKRRRDCLSREERRYRTVGSGGKHQRFLRNSRRSVATIRRNDCYSNAYANLF